MIKYVLTRQADLDLEGIILYTARRWSFVQAKKYVKELEQYIQDIANGIIEEKQCEQLATNGLGLCYYRADHHYIIYRKIDKVTQVISLCHDEIDFEYYLYRLILNSLGELLVTG